MDRTTIVLLSLGFIVVWMLGKRFLGKSKSETSSTPGTEIMRQVESWFGIAQEQVSLMDKTVRAERETEWDAKPESERLEMTNEFLSRHFDESTVKLYRDEEKLRIGSTWYISTFHSQD